MEWGRIRWHRMGWNRIGCNGDKTGRYRIGWDAIRKDRIVWDGDRAE